MARQIPPASPESPSADVSGPAGAVGFVFLDLNYDTALQRVQERAGHFFSPELVANQFATLERPDGECAVLSVDATLPLTDIVLRAQSWQVLPAAQADTFSQNP